MLVVTGVSDEGMISQLNLKAACLFFGGFCMCVGPTRAQTHTTLSEVCGRERGSGGFTSHNRENNSDHLHISGAGQQINPS